MHAVYNILTGFPDRSDDVPVVEGEVVEECAPYSLRDWIFRNDCDRCALESNQALCREHGLSISSDVQGKQVLIKDTLTV